MRNSPVWPIARISRLWAGWPGTSAEPLSPPFKIASRESSRKPPDCFLGPWQPMQCSTSMGLTAVSKKSSRSAAWAAQPRKSAARPQKDGMLDPRTQDGENAMIPAIQASHNEAPPCRVPRHPEKVGSPPVAGRESHDGRQRMVDSIIENQRGVRVAPLQGWGFRGGPDPGWRFALPWALSFRPVGASEGLIGYPVGREGARG